MDSFEKVVSEILWMQGLWVQTSVKVNLNAEEKVKINRPSSPRWELDVVAYSGRENLLYVVECKSYLDSRGVTFAGVTGTDKATAARYKLFTDEKLWKVVSNRLRLDFAERRCAPGLNIRLCLACGRIATQNDRIKLRDHFKERDWQLWDEDWLREHLNGMANAKYENQISYVVAKLLREKKAAPFQSNSTRPAIEASDHATDAFSSGETA
jgi:hypothetical protein